MGGWSLADAWSHRGPATAFRPLTLMALAPAVGAAYFNDVSPLLRVVFAAGVVMVAYLCISVMLYVVMRSVGRPSERREVQREEAGDLAAIAETFGCGVGISAEAWRYFRDDDVVAAATMPQHDPATVVALSTISGGEASDGVAINFLGRSSGQRVALVSHQAPIFPIKDIDWFFDTQSSARGLWEFAQTLVPSSAAGFSVDDFGEMQAQMNLAKQAGFGRFCRTWGWAVWRRRGVVRGFA